VDTASIFVISIIGDLEEIKLRTESLKRLEPKVTEDMGTDSKRSEKKDKKRDEISN